MAAYIALSDMKLYVDDRVLRELISDTGTDGDPDIDPDNVLFTAITRASDEVASAATRSNAYTTTELSALATATDGVLCGLVADLTLCYLFERRGGDVPESVKAKANRANDRLNDLRDGKRVFAVAANRDSGTATVAIISASTRGSLAMNADGTFFPSRRTREY